MDDCLHGVVYVNGWRETDRDGKEYEIAKCLSCDSLQVLGEDYRRLEGMDLLILKEDGLEQCGLYRRD